MITIYYETQKKAELSKFYLKRREKRAIKRYFNEYLRFKIAILILSGFQVEEFPNNENFLFQASQLQEHLAYKSIIPFWEWHEMFFCNYDWYDHS